MADVLPAPAKHISQGRAVSDTGMEGPGVMVLGCADSRPAAGEEMFAPQSISNHAGPLPSDDGFAGSVGCLKTGSPNPSDLFFVA